MTTPEKRALPGQMPDGLPENVPMAAGFAPRELARHLLRTVRIGALGTIDRNTGHPVATLVTVATDTDGSPLILVSALSSHTANLTIDGRASLLLSTHGKGDPLAHPRLTVLGSFVRVNDGEGRERVKGRFLARHPKAALYVDFGDFAFFRLNVASGHLNGGFARAADLPGRDLVLDLGGAASLLAAEASAVAHMNDDHADAVGLYATSLAGEEPGLWRLTGVDPEGVDLMAGDRTARVVFDAPVTTADELHTALVQLAQRARAKVAG